MSARRHKAFTVVELLVVIGIIGVLAAILLPAIQAARRAAWRAQCASNLKECSGAINMYATDKGHFPASRTLATVGGSTVVFNWVYPVLPQLEQDTVHKQIMTGSFPTEFPLMEVLICPVQHDFAIDELVPSVYPTGYEKTRISYMVNGGRLNADGTGSTQVNLDQLANGVFIDKGVTPHPGKDKCRISDIVDGASNTLMMCETVNGQSWVTAPKQQHSQVLWFPEDPNTTSGFVGLNQDDRASSTTVDNNPRYARPSSKHSQGFNVVMCDESVHFMADTVDYRVYAALMTSHGLKANDPNNPVPDNQLPDPDWQSPTDPNWPGIDF